MHSQMEYKVHGNKFERLQAKIRKSEMERQELECRFQNLMRSSNECEKSSLKVLRAEYKKFMDEERQRAERNENLLQTLDRIDFQAAALAAKTERLKLLKTQYKTLLLKNWTGDSGSRIVSHRSNISSPQDSVSMRYARTSPVYHHSGWNLSDGDGMRNAPQIRDMEIQTSLSMFDPPQSSSMSTWAQSWREPESHEGNHGKLAGNHPNDLEVEENEEPKWNKTPNSAVTSTITTSQSDYQNQSWDTNEVEDEKLMSENSKISEEPRKESFYLREMPQEKSAEQEMDGRKMPECDTPESQKHEEVPQTAIDSGQSEISEQLGNLSRETPKPHTSSLRHALLKNTKHELTGSRSDKGGQKVVKRVEFCLDQNKSHEDTKSQWNLDGTREPAPSHTSTEIEVDAEPAVEPLMSPYQHMETFEAPQEVDQFDDEYPDELDSERSPQEEEEFHAEGSNIQEESVVEEGENSGQVEYVTEESTIDYTPQTHYQEQQQYSETVQETEPYYVGTEDNLQPSDEGQYVPEASFAAQPDYMQDNIEVPEVASTPSALLTQDTMVEQNESPYQQFISPDANAQPDTYQDGFTAPTEYLGAAPQDFGTNEVYTSEYQYEGAAVNQQGEYVEYDVTGASQEAYDPNQGMMAYDQNYATYEGQDVHYPSDGTMPEGYEQNYSDANYVEAGGAYTEGGQVYEGEGVYMTETPETQQVYPNYQGDQYGQQEDPGDYYLGEQADPPNQDAHPQQTLQVENAIQEATSPQTTYSDDSSNFVPNVSNDPVAESEEKPPPKSNFLDSSSSESERRPKVKFADEEKKPADESDFDFSSHDK